MRTDEDGMPTYAASTDRLRLSGGGKYSLNVQRQVPARTAFIFPERRIGTNGFCCMEQATQYRKFAEECRRYAAVAKTDEQRNVLLEMAAVWTKLAKEAEERPVSRGII